jgi:formylglycine-generating enzyme required for sulfatase activity
MLPGPPWDGTDASNGDSPLAVVGATEATLAGLHNDVAYYVAVSLVSEGIESPTSDPMLVIPRRNASALALIPGGVFTMGASPGIGDADEEPAHPVYVDSLWMDRYVATNSEYRACYEAGVCDLPRRTSSYVADITLVENYFFNPIYDGYPVVYLEHQSASDYCGWRGMRLPTEAEWEHAARGAGPALYPWGSSEPVCSMANFNEDGLFCVGGTVPVGSYPKNITPEGVVEMGGNVWEWTQDWYGAEYYSESPCENPAGPETGTQRVLRGGAWYYPVDAMSVTYRNQWEPEFLFTGNPFGDYRGFGVRCVKDAPTVPCDPTISPCELPEECGTDRTTGESGDEVPDVNEPDVTEDVDIEIPDVTTSDGTETVGDAEDTPDTPLDDGETGEDTDSDNDASPECINPQDDVPYLSPCYETMAPQCPSGWVGACQDLNGDGLVEPCACALGVTIDPGTCGDELMTVTMGWRDVLKNVHPFQSDEPMEICEGFQGGVHISVVFQVEAPQIAEDFFYGDLYAELRIDGVVVGAFIKETTKLSRGDNDLFTSKLQQVRFEGCSGASYNGQDAVLEVLVRDKNDHLGRSQTAFPLKDDVQGPFLDVGQVDPC